MLDHQHGIAQVPQALQGLEQAVVVPLVQADARLVKNVEDTHQAGPDLRRQPDALRFPAAESAALAVQSQIAQSDVLEETEPRPDFLDQVPRDLPLEISQH